MRLFERLGLSSRQAIRHENAESETSHFRVTSQQESKIARSGENTARRNVLVALHADEMDDELVRLGCLMAKAKKGRVLGIYGIEVPRTLAIGTLLPEIAEKAEQTLKRAVTVAESMRYELEPEIVQTRHSGRGVVEEATTHSCGLIILGIPYRTNHSGLFDPGEVVPYVLRYATCRVWVIRGQQHGF
ncbi:MAG TPA: universal stress protein [Ktedonobacterales bacterium]|nr:universal stress protein [Ktedonobacterales bacterium]